MARLHLPDPDTMSASQRAVHDEAATGRRGHAPAPMRAWIRNPELARRAQRLGELLRYETTLPPRLSELAILLVARHWRSHYEWKVHRAEAVRAGLDEATIVAIVRGERPALADAPARAVFAVSEALLLRQAVDDALYAEAVAALGETALVELVAVLGYYGLVSMTLNAFEIGLPESFQDELA